MHNHKKWIQGVVLAGVTGVSVNAAALDWGIGAEAGLRYESNPTKVSSNEKSDYRRIGQIDGFVDYEGAHTTAKARYEALHESWNDNSLSDRNTVTGYGEFNWQPTEYFRWYAQDQSQDLIVNNAAADTSSNRNVRNTLTTGAEFTAHVTQVDSIGVQPVYQRVSFQESTGTDSTRPGATLYWQHLLSEVSYVSLNAFAEKIKFDGNSQGDIKRQNFYAEYSAQLSRLEYKLQLGYTWTNPASGSSTNGVLMRFNANYNYQNQTIQVFATHVITDNSIGLNGSSVAGLSFNPQDTNIQQFDVVTRDQAYISYLVTLPDGRWNLGANYRYDKQNFENLPNDERRNIFELRAGYQFNPAVSLNAYANYEKREFLSDPQNRTDNLYTFGLSLGYNFFRYGSIIIGAERQKRDSDVSGADYTNNAVFARIRLTFP